MLLDVFEELDHSVYSAGCEGVLSSVKPASKASLPWTAEDAFLVIPGPWHSPSCFILDVNSGECFRVDSETDVLSPDDYIKHERGEEPGPLIQSKTGQAMSEADCRAGQRQLAERRPD